MAASRQGLRRHMPTAADENNRLAGSTSALGGGLKAPNKTGLSQRTIRAPLQSIGNKNATQATSKANKGVDVQETVSQIELKNRNSITGAYLPSQQSYFAQSAPVENALSEVGTPSHLEEEEEAFLEPMDTDTPKASRAVCGSNMSIGESDSMGLEEEVYDIDASDTIYPEYVSAYVVPIYDYLYERQLLFMVSEDYFDNQADITPKMRAVLIDWLVDVHLKFKLNHETLFLTVNTLDRYLSVTPVARNKLQLIGVVSMLIASKMEEIYAPEVRDFVFITDRAYSKEEILEAEALMLNTLQFRFGVPLCLHFLRRMSKSADATPQLHTLAKYFLELTMCSTSMFKYTASEIAAGSLCLAVKMLNLEWTPTMAYYSRYTEEDITPCLLDLFELVKKSTNSRFQASRRKYQQSRFFQVANIADMQAQNVLPAE